jgi:hypothetical protein
VEYVVMTEYAFPSLGGPSYNTAFGVPNTAGYGAGYYTTNVYTQSNGMTLRDYFAGQALAGIYYRGSYTDKVAAAIAYEAADAMLKERAKSG